MHIYICNINFLVLISKSQGVVTEENSEELVKALISFISNISHYCNLLDTMERFDRKTKAIGFTTSYSYVSFNLLVFGVNIIIIIIICKWCQYNLSPPILSQLYAYQATEKDFFIFLFFFTILIMLIIKR
jgi:hypothetical protein